MPGWVFGNWLSGRPVRLARAMTLQSGDGHFQETPERGIRLDVRTTESF